MTSKRAFREIASAVLLAGAALASLLVVGNARQVVTMLDLPAFPWTNRVFDAGLLASFVTLTCLAAYLLGVLLRPLRTRGRLPLTAGTLMVEFALVLPLLLLVGGVIIQLALIANAALVVRYSAFVGARAAIVRFEPTPLWELKPVQILRGTEGIEKISTKRADEVKRATVLVLATISPQTRRPAIAGATDLDDAIAISRIYNPSGSYRYPARVEYADAHTRVTITDTPSPYVPDDPHLVAPFSDADTVPVIPPPVVWEPPKSFDLSLDFETVLEVMGLDDTAAGVFQALLAVPMNILGNVIPPVTLGVPGDYGPAFTFDLAGLELSLKIPIPKVLVDLATFRPKIHPFPEQVEVEIEYDFLITIPGMNLVPGLVDPAPPESGGYGTFPLRRSVQLQSTGVREGSPLAILYGDPSL